MASIYDTYPKGIYLQGESPLISGATPIRPDIALAKSLGYSFIVPRLGDQDQLYSGSWNNKKYYVDKDLEGSVQTAHNLGMLCFPLYRLGISDDYPLAPKTPGECLQSQTVIHALTNKTYQGIVVTVPGNPHNITDGNIKGRFSDFEYILSKTIPSKPTIWGTTQAIWEYGLWGQVGQWLDWVVTSMEMKIMVLGAFEGSNGITKPPTPGNIQRNPNTFWARRWAKIGNVYTYEYTFCGTEQQLLDYYGTPANYSAPVIPPEDPEDPPVEDPLVEDPNPPTGDTTGIIAALDKRYKRL